MARRVKGIFRPTRGKRTGLEDQPCLSGMCRDKGYRPILVKWYQSARQFAAPKRKPLDPVLDRAGPAGEGAREAEEGRLPGTMRSRSWVE